MWPTSTLTKIADFSLPEGQARAFQKRITQVVTSLVSAHRRVYLHILMSSRDICVVIQFTLSYINIYSMMYGKSQFFMGKPTRNCIFFPMAMAMVYTFSEGTLFVVS